MRLFGTITILALAATPAWAGATAWQELAPGVKLRVVTSDTLRADGTTLAALELDMPAGTKTYWRVPGESGIPTELDAAGSTGITGHRFLWPYPVIEEQNGYTDFVYHGPTVIPLELSVEGDVPVLNGTVLMGVCSDICIPATADFSLPMDFSNPDGGQAIRIDQALANTPIDWTGPGDPVGELTYDRSTGLLHVPVDTREIDPGSLIAVGASSDLLFGAPQKSPEPGVVTLPLLGGDDGQDFGDKPVRLLFMTPNGPFEVSRPVKASTP